MAALIAAPNNEIHLTINPSFLEGFLIKYSELMNRYQKEINLARSENDEFDLVDFIVLLWQGKYKIISSIIIICLLSFIYLIFAKEKWTSETVLTRPTAGQIAGFNSTLNVINTSSQQDRVTIQQLQLQIFDRFASSIYALSDTLNNLENPELLKVSQYRNGQDDPLIIKYTADSAKKAQEKLQHYVNSVNSDITDDYINDLKRTLNVKKSELENTIKVYTDVAQERKKHRLAVINNALLVAKQSKLKETQLSQAEYLSDDTLYLLGTDGLTAMLENENSKPIVYDDSFYSAQQALLSLNSLALKLDGFNSYRYVMKPTLPYKRESPRNVLILAIAILLGGVIGTVYIIAENVYKRRVCS